MRDYRVANSEAHGQASEAPSAGTPGKDTLASQLQPESSASAPIAGRLQLKSTGGQAAPSGQSFVDTLSGTPTDIATRGLRGAGSEVPYRGEMEDQFGTSFADVRAH